MCCLYGIFDPNHSFSGKQHTKMFRALAAASESRGTDAAGAAYNAGGKLRIYKRPLPAHLLRFRIPEDALAVMGHSRMTTQGDEAQNSNNHPFPARVGIQEFALAHNGVLYNDKELRITEHLPHTSIETDSYVAVQLIQKKGTLHFDSLRYMAEKVEGSFAFTVLDQENSLYFIKGDNPLCIYYYREKGLYLYASTEEILLKALSRIPYRLGKPVQVVLDCGDMLKIDAAGDQFREEFDTRNLFCHWHFPYSFMLDPPSKQKSVPVKVSSNAEYIQALKSVASFYGFTPAYVDALLEDGFTTDDVETMLYCGEF